MTAITMSSLKKPRREGKAEFTYLDEPSGEIRTEEIPISFLKPTEALWNELAAMEKVSEEAEPDDQARKGVFVSQLARVEIQSPAITEDDGRPHSITEEDLASLDLVQLAQLWAGVKSHFFLRTPVSTSETNTSSISAPASAA